MVALASVELAGQANKPQQAGWNLQDMLGITATLSPVFAPGRMVDYPGYSLPGLAASLLFLLLTVKHPGRVPFSLAGALRS